MRPSGLIDSVIRTGVDPPAHFVVPRIGAILTGRERCHRPPYFEVMRVSNDYRATVGGNAITRINTTMPMMFSIRTRLTFRSSSYPMPLDDENIPARIRTPECQAEGHARTGGQCRQDSGNDANRPKISEANR